MRSLKPALAAACVALASTASSTTAAVVPTIDFDVAQDYDGNFIEMIGAASVNYHAAGQQVRYNPLGNNSTAVIRYDTNPSDTAHGPADFLTETVAVDTVFSNLASGSGQASGSIGIFTRIQDNNQGVLALFNAAGTSSARLRLFYGADASGTSTGAGTAFYDSTISLTNGIANGTPLHLTLTQTAGSDPTFSFSISDAEGLVASTGEQTLTETDLYNSAGSVGLRFNLGLTGNTIDIDNFAAAAIPEPSTALAFLSSALLLRRRQRA